MADASWCIPTQPGALPEMPSPAFCEAIPKELLGVGSTGAILYRQAPGHMPSFEAAPSDSTCKVAEAIYICADMLYRPQRHPIIGRHDAICLAVMSAPFVLSLCRRPGCLPVQTCRYHCVFQLLDVECRKVVSFFSTHPRAAMNFGDAHRKKRLYVRSWPRIVNAINTQQPTEVAVGVPRRE